MTYLFNVVHNIDWTLLSKVETAAQMLRNNPWVDNTHAATSKHFQHKKMKNMT